MDAGLSERGDSEGGAALRAFGTAKLRAVDPGALGTGEA